MAATRYRYKTEIDLKWDENKRAVKMALGNVARRAENEVLNELRIIFDEALDEGRLLDITLDEKAAKQVFKKTRELNA